MEKNKTKFLVILIFTLIIFTIVLYSYFLTNVNNEKTVNNDSLKKDKMYEISNLNNKKTKKQINIVIKKDKINLNGKIIERWLYTDENNTSYSSGKPIVVNEGDNLDIKVINKTDIDTNIHWHGMSVKNNQDGPGITIKPNGKYNYNFRADKAGTYWYHSHMRPVRDQVDNGMYAPFIVKAKTDSLYSKDYILMLDDWNTKNNKNNSHMTMEEIGDVDTVNGKTGNSIQPITIKTNEIQKLRFIGSSTALTHNILFPTKVKVTHTDGRALETPFLTNSLSISPGERYDVELQMDFKSNKEFYIISDRDNGIKIPIYYTYDSTIQKKSNIFKPNKSTKNLDDLSNKKIDYTMRLSLNKMEPNSSRSMMSWTINDQIYPNLQPLKMDLNKEYIIRFENKDSMHSMAHPMHIHGTHFTVLNINGDKIKTTVQKDTINVPSNGYVDIAIKFDKSGEWMLHCHILDHEDSGMMTSIIVK